MDDKTIIDITNLDAEKHAENAAKRVASYSEKLLHHASILSEKEYQKFLLERLEKDNGYVIVRQVTLIVILQLTVRCSLSF